MHLVNILRIITFSFLVGHSILTISDFNSFRFIWDTLYMPPKTVEVRNYKNCDSELFKKDLSYVPLDILEMKQNPEEALNSFKDLFRTVADSHAPFSTRRVRGRSLPWSTREVKNLMKERDYCHNKDKSRDLLVQLQKATQCCYWEITERKKYLLLLSVNCIWKTRFQTNVEDIE